MRYVSCAEFKVLFPVRLDDQPALKAREIGDERTKRVLTAEFEPAQPAVAQPRPQKTLGFGRFAACGAGLEVGHERQIDAHE